MGIKFLGVREYQKKMIQDTLLEQLIHNILKLRKLY